MKTIYSKLAVLVAAMMMSMAMTAKTYDVSGKVIDEQGEPIAFVNVVLLSMPDSAFVQGAVTDAQGAFRIVTDKNDGLLRLTSIGYETVYIKAASGLTIRMREDTQLLGEVTVKSTLPKTFVKGDAMRTTVDGTILEKAGTAGDALSKIPSIESERDGSVKVLGRGDAEVYINGRKVIDQKELGRLRADQIQYVDVVQNPGARYAASTKAVVRITLKKAQGDGLSFQEDVLGYYQYGITLQNILDLNYRKGGLDITASFLAGHYGHSKSLQEDAILYYVGPDRYDSYSTQDAKQVSKTVSPQLQVNYMLNDNHSFGAYYKFDRNPDDDFTDRFLTDNYVNGIPTEHSESDVRQQEQSSKHIFNAYYNGKVQNLSIDLNVDGLFDDTKAPGSTTETTRVPGGAAAATPRSINSNTLSANNFWASKLIFGYPVLKGNLSIGGEYSHNHRTDAYGFMSTDAVPVKATDTEINESSAAAFMEYGRMIGSVYAQVGLRYEHLKNDYFNFGVREDEVCRNYGDWFPTAVISAPIKNVQLSLSYRRDIERPHYSSLTSSTIYINRYTYQSGNPYLKPTYTHSLVLNAAYKWLSLSVDYARITDSETMSTEPYPGSADPLISLVRPINTSEDYNRLTIVPTVRPTINFKLSTFNITWHPTWTAYAIFQNYKTPTADGSIKTLSRPYFQIAWQNDIELPHDYRVNLNAQWAAKGDYDNFRVTRTRFNLSAGLQHDVNLRHLGILTLDFRCFDPFNTNKVETTVYGMRELTAYNPARRTFMVNLTWKFNEARSKYRGSGAGEKQKARM